MFLIYKFLTTALYPIFILVIYIRKFLNKEDPIRFKEKLLHSNDISLPDSSKTLIWFHGASIGEISSIIPLINHITDKDKSIFILITSVTLSSGKVVNEIFKDNKNILHQYFPLDVPYLTKKFLDRWNPSVIAFIDSEIWPNFIDEIKKRKKTLLLLNARITKKTYKRWKFVSSFAKKNFSSFDLSIASSIESLNNLKKLGSNQIKYYGNLKFISKIDTTNHLSSNAVNFLNDYKVWCAASTHKGEDLFCINVHKKLKKHYDNILTIIIPRHIDRVKDIYSQCLAHNLKTQVINKNDQINSNVEVIIINSYGVLPKYYNYCQSIFMGKSLMRKFISVGGQNPIEAAKSGCNIYHGPYVYNFNEVYDFLEKSGIAKKINNSQELVDNLVKDLKNPKKLNNENLTKLNTFGENIFGNTIKELDKYIL